MCIAYPRSSQTGSHSRLTVLVNTTGLIRSGPNVATWSQSYAERPNIHAWRIQYGCFVDGDRCLVSAIQLPINISFLSYIAFQQTLQIEPNKTAQLFSTGAVTRRMDSIGIHIKFVILWELKKSEILGIVIMDVSGMNAFPVNFPSTCHQQHFETNNLLVSLGFLPKQLFFL